MTGSTKKKALFTKLVWDFYHANKRAALPWRKKISAYRVWVSEIMLQQTQVDRVVPFFNAWMEAFPAIETLAEAPLPKILGLWKGLGYNSRAIRMKKTAEAVVEKHRGAFPKKLEDILELPGIGPYTAGAITAFAYNKPVSFIETNIRRVYIHHFFNDSPSVHDRDILKIIEEIVDQKNPREWYWALMDYGSHLGKTVPNPNRKSRHYTKQSVFKGSDREIRGRILSVLLGSKKISLESLREKLGDVSADIERIEGIVSGMEKDGFLTVANGAVRLKK